jgi:hypothetical protein
VPPVAVAIVLLLPSEPVTTTPVAFVAVTVSVELAPAATVVGLAVMVTVGEFGCVFPAWTEPHPAKSNSSGKAMTRASNESVERRTRGTRTCTMELSFLMFRRAATAQPANSKLKEYKAGSLATGRQRFSRAIRNPKQ